jgi:hypothetical protein
MLKRQQAFTLVIALLSLVPIATSQTTTTTSGSAKKSASVAVRKLPTIKCVDPNSTEACESFSQLVRVSDIPKFIIGFPIAVLLLRGLFSLRRLTGAMPEWVGFSLLLGIAIVSVVCGHYLWKVVCNEWKKRLKR